MICDIRRLRGVSYSLLAVAVFMAGYGLILRATLGRMTSWITLRSQNFNVKIVHQPAISRVLGLKRDLGAPGASGQRVGVLLGASTLRQGVDTSVLNAEVDGGYRWTSVTLPGLAHETAVVNRIMFESGVKPDVLVVFANPGILVADSDLVAQAGRHGFDDLLQAIKVRYFERVRSELVILTMVPWNVMFPYRGQVFTLVDRELFQTKLRMFRALGLGIDALAVPERDPWMNEFPPELVEGTPAGNENILRFIGIKGWYDPANYRADGPNFESIADIFRLAHQYHAKTFMVFAPESSQYRAKLPSSATYHFRTTLAQTLGDAAPVILDYRQSVPDEDFMDVNHLGKLGRTRFTHQLAAGIAKSLGQAGK